MADGITDILVKFVGGSDRDVGNEATDRVVLPANYGAQNRRLVGVVRGANKDRPNLVQSAFDEVIRIIGEGPTGLLCIRGNSRGGIWSIEMAEKLTARGIPISFIGLQDAAFSTVDAINAPSSRFQSAIDNVPLFETQQITAGVKLSHFQIIGNKAEFQFRSGNLIWASDMDGEIHGEVRGFQSDRISVTGWQKDDAGNAHNFCCGRAETKDVLTIGELLLKACS